MAKTNKDVVDALKRAAEDLLRRTLTPREFDDLVDRFKHAQGTFHQRAREALRRSTRLTEEGLRRRAAASDNTDRILTDLQNVLDDWQAGK